jgi:hypothetical protein
MKRYITRREYLSPKYRCINAGNNVKLTLSCGHIKMVYKTSEPKGDKTKCTQCDEIAKREGLKPWQLEARKQVLEKFKEGVFILNKAGKTNTANYFKQIEEAEKGLK